MKTCTITVVSPWLPMVCVCKHIQQLIRAWVSHRPFTKFICIMYYCLQVFLTINIFKNIFSLLNLILYPWTDQCCIENKNTGLYLCILIVMNVMIKWILIHYNNQRNLVTTRVRSSQFSRWWCDSINHINVPKYQCAFKLHWLPKTRRTTYREEWKLKSNDWSLGPNLYIYI